MEGAKKGGYSVKMDDWFQRSVYICEQLQRYPEGID